MLLDELQEHISERYFSHYINPNLLSAIYSATGRKMASLDQQPSDNMTYDDDDGDNENQKKKVNDNYHSDQRRQHQGLPIKNHMYAEEIDDNLDYGTIDD